MHRSDISRQEYLKRREVDKLQELRDALEDEERLFEVGPGGVWRAQLVAQGYGCKELRAELRSAGEERLFKVGCAVFEV